jgi:cytochrome c oxidase subunit 2
LRPRSHKHALTLALAAAVAALLASAPAAVAGVLLPERGGSPNADDISTLYAITFYIGVAIFVLVEGLLIWSLVKFRARRDGPEAQQIRGNTPLELGWTAGAALIVVLLAVVTFVYLGGIKDPVAGGEGTLAGERPQYAGINQPSPPGGRTLNVAVNGQQYVWRFDYPGKEQLFTYYEMVVPVDTTVTLDIRSQDVAHSWWVPKLGGKADALPGHTSQTWFKISEAGRYTGVCAELCGDNHADMRAVVRAVPVEEFEAWAAQQRRDIKAAQEALAAQRRLREQSEQ